MTPRGGCREVRQSLGVYVLGAIDPAERSQVDEHLTTCLDCREELASLAGLPALLRKIPTEEAERLAAPEPAADGGPGEELLQSLLTRTARVRRIRRWRGLAAAAAVVVAVVGGGVAAVEALQPAAGPVAAGKTHGALHGSWQRVSAADPLSGATLTVDYKSMPWGTQIKANVFGVKLGTVCLLKATDAAGRTWTVGTWQVDGSTWWYPASTAVHDRNLRSFELTAGGRLLVQVPVPVT